MQVIEHVRSFVDQVELSDDADRALSVWVDLSREFETLGVREIVAAFGDGHDDAVWVASVGFD